MRDARQAAPTPMFRAGAGFEREWPGASALATECVLNLYMTVSRLESVSETAVRAAGFPSLAAFNVLTVLEGAGTPLTPSVIAARVFVTRGTMTGILKSLEARRLIRQSRSEADGRSRKVEPAPGVREEVRQYLARVHDAERRLAGTLSVARQRDLLKALAALQAELENFTI